MKRILTSSCLSFILLASAHPALAQVTATTTGTTTSNTTTNTRGGQLRPFVGPTDALERETKREERMASRAARLDERKQAIVERVLAMGRRMLKRATHHLQNLDHIWGRVQTRMDKMKTNGKDLSSLDSMVADVKTKQQAGSEAISSAQSALNSLEGTNEPKTAVQTFHDKYKTVIESLRAYHASIVTVIRSLKGMSGPETTKPPAATGAGSVTGTP